MGERSTPMAVETVARALVDAGQATRVVAIELPHSHAFMHLDTVMSMAGTATFVLYPYFDRNLRSWTISPGEQPGQLAVARNHSLWDTLAEILEVDQITVLATDEDIRAAEREQWDDGTNYLAVAPGVVFGYEFLSIVDLAGQLRREKREGTERHRRHRLGHGQRGACPVHDRRPRVLLRRTRTAPQRAEHGRHEPVHDRDRHRHLGRGGVQPGLRTGRRARAHREPALRGLANMDGLWPGTHIPKLDFMAFQMMFAIITRR
jgi:hypothetical protein